MASTFTFYEMFSYELTTNPWMFYEFTFPAADWYEVMFEEWHGKSAQYALGAPMYFGWFGAQLDSGYIRTRFFASSK